MRDSTQQIGNQVYQLARQGRFVLTVSGDHSIGIGSVTRIAQAIHKRISGHRLAVLWVDAHADISPAQVEESMGYQSLLRQGWRNFFNAILSGFKRSI